MSFTRLRQWLCSLRGHSTGLPQQDAQGIRLKCHSCGFVSPGWLMTELYTRPDPIILRFPRQSPSVPFTATGSTRSSQPEGS
jgi:hypothetical protein